MNTEQEGATTTENDASVAHTEVSNTPTPKAFYKDIRVVVSILVAILILAGALYYAYSTKGTVVVVVNGEKLYLEALEENIESIRRGAEEQGIDTTNPGIQEEIKRQSLQALIDNALILGAVEKTKIELDTTEVDRLYTEIIGQLGGEESSVSELAALGLTQDKLRDNLKERVLIESYLASVTDIEELTVSEDDITAFLAPYDPAQLPPLEEIRAEVESQILLQKRQTLFLEVIEKLRAEATIEEKI